MQGDSRQFILNVQADNINFFSKVSDWASYLNYTSG